MKLILLGVLSIFIGFYVFVEFFVPHGEDVNKAVLLRDEIQKIIDESGLRHSKDENLVLMKERRNSLEAVIVNPKPSESVIFDLIKKQKKDIDIVIQNKEDIVLTFKDSNMKEKSRFVVR